MFLGLRTEIYYVDDIAKAKEWYRFVLGFAPYFDEPFYVGFNVGGFELGLHPGGDESAEKAAGVVAYWGVDNVAADLQRLVSLGATRHEHVQAVGGGIQVPTVKDPFGNVFGRI